MLYIIPTPIGNLEDITLRALRILKEVDVILAEDTRTTGILLKHYEIRKPLQSYHIFNEHHTVAKILERLKNGENIALVSDAGTPSISDPGFLLVRACVEADIEVNCLPGATAFVPALVQSGLPSDTFIFDGFLPHKKGKQTRLKQLSEEEKTVVCYESPHRLLKTLEMMIPYFGADRRCSVSRELSKIYQETKNGTIEEVLAYFTQKGVKGEIVMVIQGKQEEKPQKG